MSELDNREFLKSLSKFWCLEIGGCGVSSAMELADAGSDSGGEETELRRSRVTGSHSID